MEKSTLKEYCVENNLILHEDITGDQLQPGDFYVASRNTGPKLLECKVYSKELNCVHSVEMAYSYDSCECRKVTLR